MKSLLASFEDIVTGKTLPTSVQIELALATEAINARRIAFENDNDRALEVVQSLEDLSIIIDSIETPSTIDSALIQVNANTMVAGTPMPATGLMPANENISEAVSVTLSKLVSIVGAGLNSYMHGITNSFAGNSDFVKSSSELLRSNKTALSTMHANFPLPDNPADDISRTVKFNIKELTYLTMLNGDTFNQTTTLGDLINAFTVTARSYKDMCLISNTVGSRLMQITREIIPNKEIQNIEDLVKTVEVNNLNLYNTLVDIWEKIISVSSLIKGSGSTGGSAAYTTPLLGARQMVIEFTKDTTTPAGEVTPLDKRSESINSFNFFTRNGLQEIELKDNQVELSGVTNADLRTFITKIKDFIIDIERFAIWCGSTSEIAKAECASNIANISKFFNEKVPGEITAEQNTKARQLMETHLRNVDTVIKAISAMTCEPLSYGNDLINGLTILLNSLPENAPAGNYNFPKPTI